MENKHTTRTPRVLTALLFLSGITLIIAAILFNEFLLESVHPYPPLNTRAVESIRNVQLVFLFSGGLIVGFLYLIRGSQWLKRLNLRPGTTRGLLIVVLVLQPLAMSEFALRVFANSKTSVFMPDEQLGWKLRPLSKDRWGGIEVKINSKGLRGPELNYEKAPDVKRILYLGDSVTFGFMVEGYQNSFPFQVESFLEPETGREIETINAGVGGYSPWQHLIFLESEGIRYHPDLIVVSFVLNDVTEKFQLTRFGGWNNGHQLSQTARGKFDWLINKSSTYSLGREIWGRVQFGSDVQKGATLKELATVRQLAEEPNADHVREAWQLTLENLRGIVHYTKDRRIPLFLVIFPFTFQFEHPKLLSAPQQVLIEFAQEEGVPFFDLLPALIPDIKTNKSSVGEYFLDGDHLTALGARRVGHILASEIEERGLLDTAAVERYGSS